MLICEQQRKDNGSCRLLSAFGFFAIFVVFFEQVHQIEDVRAEIDEGGQVGLEGCLPTTTRATDQHFSVIP